MKMHEHHIDEDDLDLFLSLADSSKLEFLYDLHHKGKLYSVRKQVERLMPEDNVHGPSIYSEHKCIVRVSDTDLIITGDKLKAVRYIAWKFMEDGHVLFRTKYTGKSSYRYKRHYKILGYFSPICLS